MYAYIEVLRNVGVKVAERWLITSHWTIVSEYFSLVLADWFFSNIEVICIWLINELFFVDKHNILCSTTKLIIGKWSFDMDMLGILTATIIIAIEAVMREIVPKSWVSDIYMVLVLW